jgi:hypothetical protein
VRQPLREAGDEAVNVLVAAPAILAVEGHALEGALRLPAAEPAVVAREGRMKRPRVIERATFRVRVRAWRSARGVIL